MGALAVVGVHVKVLVEVIALRDVQVLVLEAAKRHALIVVMQMQEDGKSNVWFKAVCVIYIVLNH